MNECRAGAKSIPGCYKTDNVKVVVREQDAPCQKVGNGSARRVSPESKGERRLQCGSETMRGTILLTPISVIISMQKPAEGLRKGGHRIRPGCLTPIKRREARRRRESSKLEASYSVQYQRQ